MSTKVSVLDSSAIGLSGLCLIHCLALPVVSAFLPLAGTLAEIEWIHKVLVLIALPVTLLAIFRHGATKVGVTFIVPALAGLGLLLSAAFVEALHDLETPLTVAGAVLLSAAHIWRWVNRDRAAVA